MSYSPALGNVIVWSPVTPVIVCPSDVSISYRKACVISIVFVGSVNWLVADVPALSVLTVIIKRSSPPPAKSK